MEITDLALVAMMVLLYIIGKNVYKAGMMVASLQTEEKSYARNDLSTGLLTKQLLFTFKLVTGGFVFLVLVAYFTLLIN